MISRLRILLIACLTFFSILTVIPTFLSEEVRKSLPGWMPNNPIVLGLDLQGGVHLLLEVGSKELIAEHYAYASSVIRKELRAQKIFYKGIRQNQDGVLFRLVNPSTDQERVNQLIAKTFGESSTLTPHPEGNGLMVLRLSKVEINRMVSQAVSKSIEVIRKRIDESGALEPIIQSQGRDRIILQIPGFDDPQRVRALLGKTAKLTFQWVSTDPTTSIELPLDEEAKTSLRVDREILLSGEEILDARIAYSQDKRGAEVPAVSITLTGKGGRLFSDLTKDSKGKELAIVLDRKVLSAPRIESHITDGRAIISGSFTMEAAQKLALMIRSGALPAPLSVLEEKVVGPGLGKDSITAGTKATGLAVVAVATWMLLIYSFFGVFAVIGIGFNLCFLFALLVLLGATLTLPGLAGVALTVGMSVDANVLINERIKEELRLGKKLKTAIENGYEKAMSSIMDSNITTLIGAALMYIMGTGPVKGFAITMALGILISLFTAIGLTKALVYLWLQWKKPTTVNI